MSVVIPALNEEGNIPGAIASVRNGLRDCEIIVADGGSTDGTIEVSKKAGAIVLSCQKGRGTQMDEGARAASGDVLVFLHADTRLPENWFKEVEKALKDERNVGGAFTFKVDDGGLRFFLLQLLVAIRVRLFGLVYGDQAVFVRATVFSEVGGFRGLPLMEDVELVRALRRKGRFVISREKALTSPRKWKSEGVILRSCKNLKILIRYLFGASPEKLYREYYG